MAEMDKFPPIFYYLANAIRVSVALEKVCFSPPVVKWNFIFFTLEQLCPTKIAYWPKNYVTILTRAVLMNATQWKTYFGLSKLNLV